MKALGHVEVVQFLRPVEAILLNLGADLGLDAFMPEPHDEAGHRVLLRQANGFEDDAQERQADTAARTGSQGAGGGVQAAMALGLGAQFFQAVPDGLRQIGNTTGGGPILEDRVAPQGTEHFDEVRFTRAVKTADPNSRLLCLVDVLQVGFEDVGHPFFILAIADKGLQLVPQDRQRLTGQFVIDAGHTLVDQFSGGRIFLVNIAILHHQFLVQYSLSAVIGTAR